MRIEVDHEVCSGHGRCWTLAPEVFEMDDDGYCSSTSIDVPPHLEEQALKGVKGCPERAIRVAD